MTYSRDNLCNSEDVIDGAYELTEQREAKEAAYQKLYALIAERDRLLVYKMQLNRAWEILGRLGDITPESLLFEVRTLQAKLYNEMVLRASDEEKHRYAVEKLKAAFDEETTRLREMFDMTRYRMCECMGLSRSSSWSVLESVARSRVPVEDA